MMNRMYKQLLVIGISVFSFGAKAQMNTSVEAKIETLIRKMTLEEKVNLLHGTSSFASGGVPRLGIPGFVTSDGPHGVRLEHGVDYTPDPNVADSGTYLPVGVCLAATWNPRLGYEFGKVLGSEAAYR